MNLKSQLYTLQLRTRQRLIGKRYASASEKIAIEPGVYQPRKLLFVLAGLIGDSVMSLPAIIEARRIWPNAHIAVLGKKHNRELIQACSFFDEFYECNADPFSLRRSVEIKKLESWLSEQGFDAAFILLGDQFAHLLARAGISVRVGVAGTALENCLTHTYEIGSPRAWGSNERLNALRCLGYSVGQAEPELSVDDKARRKGREKLAALGLDESRDYAVLHPFGSTRRQWWKVRAVGALAAKLEERDLQTVLIGGSETVFQISKEVTVIDSTGQLTLPELLAVIDGSKLVITTDSGPFHIAGALGKPILGLFRSRRPEHAKQYRTASVLFGENELCMQACKWDSCETEPCKQMEDITIEDVAESIELFLNTQ